MKSLIKCVLTLGVVFVALGQTLVLIFNLDRNPCSILFTRSNSFNPFINSYFRIYDFFK